MTTFPQIVPPPAWVSSGAKLTDGLDLLGLRVPVQAIGNNLLSGVTTISPTVRYIGLRAWIIRRYAEARLPDAWASFREFAGRVEAAIAIGNLLVDRQTAGLAGRELGSKLADGEEDPLELRPLIDQLAVSAYAGPSDQLGVSFDRESRVAGITEERGIPLAEAVEIMIGHTAFARGIKDDPAAATFSRADLSEVGAAFRIATPVGDERVALLEAILPLNPRPSEIGRLATYGILLELCDLLGRRVREEDLFTEAVRRVRLVQNVYDTWMDGWVAYLVRDVVAVVCEAALGAIIDEIAPREDHATPQRVTDVMRALLGREDELEEPLRTLRIMPERAGQLDKPLQSLQAALRDVTRPRTPDPFPRWDGPAEPDVMRLALSIGAGALTLLPISWLLARERVEKDRGQGAGAELLSYQGWSRMGLEQVILPGLEDMLRRNLTIRHAIYEVGVRSVDQHLRIAWSRMAAEPHKDVAVLATDGETWHFRKRFSPGRTASRLFQAIGWLSQLELIDDTGCTEDGRKHLLRIRSILSRTGGPG